MTHWSNPIQTRMKSHPSASPRRRAGRIAVTCLMLAGMGLMASGCSGFRKAIGEEKSSPDEFEVVVRPPLSLPPNFAASSSQLTETAPAAASQDSPIDARSVAAAELGAAQGSAADVYQDIFDFSAVPADIREIVDEETYGIQFENRIPLQMLFGGLPDVGPVLDKFAEDQRLRRVIREGTSPTDGGTPALDLIEDEPVTIGN